MRRGQVWRHAPTLRDGTPSPRHAIVVLVSDPAVIASPYRWLHVVPLTDDDPGHVLASSTTHGWADTLELHRVYRPWLTDQLGTVTTDELDAIDTRLRATLGL